MAGHEVLNVNQGKIMEVIEQPQVAIQAQPTPYSLLAIAVQQGADIDKLERLLALQERWEAEQSRKAYYAAFAAFKAEAATIIKNKKVTAGPLAGKSYAELFAVVEAITPALSKHGISASWKITKDEKDWIEVTCMLRHVGGHSESVSMGSPPDAGGAKNAIQARASSVTYLERYTLKAITGLSEQEDDDDGGKGVDEQRQKRPVADRTHIMKIRAAIQEHIAADRPLGALQEYESTFELDDSVTNGVWAGLTTPERNYLTAQLNAKQDREAQMQDKRRK